MVSKENNTDFCLLEVLLLQSDSKQKAVAFSLDCKLIEGQNCDSLVFAV